MEMVEAVGGGAAWGSQGLGTSLQTAKYAEGPRRRQDRLAAVKLL